MGGALRIEWLPIQEALRHTPADNESVIAEGRSAIVSRNIEGLTFGVSSNLQCVLWVNGSAEALQTLRSYLDEQHILYTAYSRGTETTGTRQAHAQP